MTDQPPAGWYPDPDDSAQQRYWDGAAWTEHRAPATQPSQYGSQPGQYGQYGQYGSGQYGAGASSGAETSGGAVVALVLGIVSIIACLGPLTGVPAIIVGRRATRDIDDSGGRVTGRGMATGGVVTGIIGCLLWALVIIAVVGLFSFSYDSSA